MTPAASFVLSQIETAAGELAACRPTNVSWRDRATGTAGVVVPWLVDNAASLCSHVEDVLNAHAKLTRLWGDVCESVSEPVAAEVERLLALDSLLRKDVTGDIVSGILVDEMCRRNPDLRANGRSDYPDVYRVSADYAVLPAFRRSRREAETEVVFGPAVKGRPPRPVRIPDGLEVKTCRRTIKVDCHHPHLGLHLILVFDRRPAGFVVTDVRVGLLRPADYIESARNTTATTVKYSFTGTRFISLLPGTDVG